MAREIVIKDLRVYSAPMGFEDDKEKPSPPPRRTSESLGAIESGDVEIRQPYPGDTGGSVRSHDDESETYEKKLRFYISMLDEPDPSRRWKAAEALARTGDDRAVDPLIRALSDEDWRVRQKVAWALGYLGDPKAIPALRRAYRGDLEGVQEMITEAIAMITSGANR